jgi:hypothetical protein
MHILPGRLSGRHFGADLCQLVMNDRALILLACGESESHGWRPDKTQIISRTSHHQYPRFPSKGLPVTQGAKWSLGNTKTITRKRSSRLSLSLSVYTLKYTDINRVLFCNKTLGAWYHDRDPSSPVLSVGGKWGGSTATVRGQAF